MATVEHDPFKSVPESESRPAGRLALVGAWSNLTPVTDAAERFTAMNDWMESRKIQAKLQSIVAEMPTAEEGRRVIDIIISKKDEGPVAAYEAVQEYLRSRE